MPNFEQKSYKFIKMNSHILNVFSLNTADLSLLKSQSECIIHDRFGMVMHISTYIYQFISKNQPTLLVEGRLFLATRGSAVFELMLEEYHVKRGDIFVLAPDSIVELKSCTEDFSMIGVVFKEDVPVDANLLVHPREKDWNEMLRLVHLLWDIAKQEPFRSDVVTHLLNGIISNLQYIDQADRQTHPPKQKSRQEQVFSRFKELVKTHCCRHRSIAFYASELALTPHYLSGVIRKVSGRSVMYWVNRATILQAKVMLKNTDMQICEVADRLHFPNQSAFTYYFKRETGTTPTQYQKGNR
ncbi:MAG: helix-turn-helix domain-containing protein [Sodaliphilus sp.]